GEVLVLDPVEVRVLQRQLALDQERVVLGRSGRGGLGVAGGGTLGAGAGGHAESEGGSECQGKAGLLHGLEQFLGKQTSQGYPSPRRPGAASASRLRQILARRPVLHLFRQQRQDVIDEAGYGVTSPRRRVRTH